MMKSGLVLLGTTWGCTAEKRSGAADIPAVTLDSTPIVSIGVEDGDPSEMLAGANSALYLREGSVVIANTNAHDIRLFDSTGRHLLTTGRLGSGPGEFRGYLTVYLDATGAVAVYDNGRQRITTYDDQWQPKFSTFLGSDDSPPSPPGPTWLWGNFWIHGGGIAQRSEIRRILQLTGLTSFHGVIPGPAGCVWTAPDGPYASRWTIHNSDGQAIQSVVLPDGAQLLQIMDARVLLRQVDSLGVIRIAVFPLEAPPECWLAPPTHEEIALDPSRHGQGPPDGLVPEVMIAQEYHYMNHARYAGADDVLDLQSSADRIVMLRGDEQGYLFVVINEENICGIAIGSLTPAFWPEGVPYCS